MTTFPTRGFSRTSPGSSAAAFTALAWFAISSTGCGGGGGGGGSTAASLAAPALVSAAFTTPGGGAPSGAPAAGDLLRLVFDIPVTVVAGTLLTDDDFVLSGGATLGAVTTSPSVRNLFTVEFALGTGVNFTPGTTTIALSTAHDAVQNSLGTLAGETAPIAILQADGNDPVGTGVTLNEIESQLNGTGIAGGTLQVPQNGFTIDVTATDATSAIDSDKTLISANVATTSNGLLMVAGSNLTPFLTRSGLSFTVPSNVLFSTGDVVLSVRVVDTTGRVSANSETFNFRVVPADPSVIPFEQQQRWFIDVSRDLESVTVTGAAPTISVTLGSNGRSDFEDVLMGMGLLSSMAGNESTNAAVLSRFRTQVLAEMDRLFPDVNITFSFDSLGTFVDAPFSSATFSQICLAGSPNDTGTGSVLGSALLDSNNNFQENDCIEDFNGARLGVFAFTLAKVGYGGGVGSAFQTTFRPFTSSAGGTPIGEAMDGLDATRVADPTSTATGIQPRGAQIGTAIDDLARALSIVIAHECGHSMGLVANDAMPAGLYGGVVSLGGSPDHIVFPPSGGLNVMSPSLDYLDSLSDTSGFNSLNLAYLRQRAIYFR